MDRTLTADQHRHVETRTALRDVVKDLREIAKGIQEERGRCMASIAINLAATRIEQLLPRIK